MASSPMERLKTAALSVPLSCSITEARAALVNDVPETISLAEISQELNSACSQKEQRASLLAILLCLDRVDDHFEPSQAASVCEFAANAIAPTIDPPEDEIEGYHPTPVDFRADIAGVASRCRPLAEPALSVLAAIVQKLPPGTALSVLDPQILITVVAYADADADQPWTTPAAAQLARDVVLGAALPDPDDRAAFIADQILGPYLRPLFSRSRPAAVTASGRRAEFPAEQDSHDTLGRETRAAKPWKHVDLRAIPSFAWALTEADKFLMSRHWPLVTPVLLALLDDGTTEVRARALRLLPVLLAKIEPKTLVNTGLDRVFQDAVFPTLLFLPSVTPEDESLQLLPPAYASLIALSRVAADAKKLTRDAGRASQMDANKILDKVIREGIFAAFFYARDHIRIVEELTRQAGLVIQEMKIHAVKHLKDIIPMLTSIMEDPFAMAHPSSVLAAIETLQTIITNCWPRLGGPPWRDAIIKALVTCWMRTREEGNGQVPKGNDIQARLIRTAEMLSAVTQAVGVEMPALVAPLVAEDTSLGELFATGP